MAEIERMLGLYRDIYRGFTVKPNFPTEYKNAILYHQLIEHRSNRGKTPGTQVQHDPLAGSEMAEIRHHCESRNRNKARLYITCPDFCPSYASNRLGTTHFWLAHGLSGVPSSKTAIWP